MEESRRQPGTAGQTSEGKPYKQLEHTYHI